MMINICKVFCLPVANCFGSSYDIDTSLLHRTDRTDVSRFKADSATKGMCGKHGDQADRTRKMHPDKLTLSRVSAFVVPIRCYRHPDMNVMLVSLVI